MSMTFSGKVALVTGGAAGIGRATALAFAAEGLQVMVSDVDVAGGEGTVQLIRDAGGEAVFVRCDVTREAEVKVLMERTLGAYGRLDYAFNNAGIEIEKGKLAADTRDAMMRLKRRLALKLLTNESIVNFVGVHFQTQRNERAKVT